MNLEKLKKYPRTRCAKCGSSKSRTNPMARCFFCKQKFCFDHIHGGCEYLGIKPNQELVDLCEKCFLTQHPTCDLGSSVS